MYREFPPPLDLAPMVDCLWVKEPRLPGGPAPSLVVRPVLPDCCFDFIYRFDGRDLRSCFLAGPMMKPILSPLGSGSGPKNEWLFGIRFKPGYLFPVVGEEGIALQDLRVGLAALSGLQGFSRLGERLAQASTDAARISQAIRTLRENLITVQGRVDPFSVTAVERILTRPEGGNLASLEDWAGYSRRQIERKFARHVGYSPKQFARVSRFKALVADLRRRSAAGPTICLDWADLALDHGYADQAHLIHEFREFSGTTPSRFLSEP